MSYPLARREDIPQLKEIWRLCFGDDDTYINLFFDSLFDSSLPVVHRDGPLVEAMLFLIPVTAVKGGKETPLYYLYAAATRPTSQGRGIMGQMLGDCLQAAKAEGKAGILLVPGSESLFGYYGSRGYENYGMRKAVAVDLAALRGEMGGAALPELRDSTPEQLRANRELYLSGVGYLRHDLPGLRFAVGDAAYYGGGALQFAGGHALYQCDAGELAVLELCAESERLAKQALLALAERHGAHTAHITLPHNCDWFGEGESHAIAMAAGLAVKEDELFTNLLFD